MRSTNRRLAAVVATTALAVAGLVAAPAPPASAEPPYPVPVTGQPILNADQLASWYNAKHKAFNVPGITVRDLAAIFIAEGAQENVRGDLAFAQSIVETGYFGYVGSMVKPWNFNFAGMGACDSCNSGRQFPNPQMGVRAQVQHLKNYADINSRAAKLRNPPVPEWYAYPSLNPTTAAHNFDTFFAKGRAPTWNKMGNGNWATSPHYSAAVISVYENMLVSNGLSVVAAAGGDPFGNLDVLGRVPGGVRVGGWTIDPSTDAPTPVDVYVNGHMVGRFVAGGSRPDVGAAFGVGSGHGFDTVVPTAGGKVCLYAINLGVGTRNTLIGCRTVIGPDPIGRLERVVRQPGGVRVIGWAIDPDIGTKVRVDIYANGVMAGRIGAGAPRPDVAQVYPPYGERHGFNVKLPAWGGKVCAYAINVGFGARNTALGCRTVLGADPVGALDQVVHESGGLRVSGWSLDPDVAGPIDVDVYVNGGMVARVPATASRPDVGRVHGGYGAGHGYDVVVPAAGGTVCAYAINVGPGTGNPLLGCRAA
jgi:hypothetical protein